MNVDAISDITKADLDTVLEQSRPRRNQSLLAPMFLAAILLAALLSVPGESVFVQSLVPIAMAAIILFSIRHASRVARRQREESEQLRLADEGIRLGRWEQVADVLARVLSNVTPRPHVRFQALIFLGGLYNRIGRFADVIRLYDHLTENAQFPPQIALSLRCMRAYAILRDERLSDAYEAIAELRRDYPQGSGMVSLLEMYRLVKTGHFDDALALFQERRAQMAEQLAHRSADAWALAAASAHALSRDDQSRMYARHAALLAHPSEIVRRLPECAAAMDLAPRNGGTGA